MIRIDGVQYSFTQFAKHMAKKLIEDGMRGTYFEDEFSDQYTKMTDREKEKVREQLEKVTERMLRFTKI